MLKPASLRQALTAAVPHLATNPQDLHIFIDQGSVRSTAAGGLSFEYGYTLNAIVTDFADHADALMIPILLWLREHQPDMLENQDRMADGFVFEADILSHEKCDISIKLKLTERVVVTLDGNSLASVTHWPEPPLEEPIAAELWALFYGPDKIAEWATGPVDRRR